MILCVVNKSKEGVTIFTIRIFKLGLLADVCFNVVTFFTSNWIPVVSLVHHITSTPFRMMVNNGKYKALFSLCLGT